MNTPVIVWLRAETKENEHRTPLTPDDARSLRQHGIDVAVEQSTQRIFPDREYADAGCRLVAAGSWADAPEHAFILAIKELPADTAPLRHRHIYFGHAYKGQPGGVELLQRFVSGGGTLLDIEFLTDEAGRRLSAFGFWAGFAGAALGLDQWLLRQASNGGKLARQKPYDNQQLLVQHLRVRMDEHLANGRQPPRPVVVGALGRCGRGAVSLFDSVALPVERWDVEETAPGGPFPALLEHDLLVNSVLVSGEIPPFLTAREIGRTNRRLSVIADVSCDPGNPGNPLPIYDRVTTFEDPVLRVIDAVNPLDIIAVDHLPSLLPRESSIDFSGQLTPWIARLAEWPTPWSRCEDHFHRHA